MISVRNVSKIFESENGRQVLFSGLSFDVAPGECVAVMGSSGSGKSTLLNMIGVIDRPDSGNIEVDGKDVHALRGTDRAAFMNRSVGFIFQSHHLIKELTPLGNVMLPMRIGGTSTKEAEKRATELLEHLGLGGQKLRRKVELLSGGECQRIAIARALANRPRVLLADEPTGSLHPGQKEQVITDFLALSKSENVATLIVTHDLQVIRSKDGQPRVQKVVHIGEPDADLTALSIEIVRA